MMVTVMILQPSREEVGRMSIEGGLDPGARTFAAQRSGGRLPGAPSTGPQSHWVKVGGWWVTGVGILWGLISSPGKKEAGDKSLVVL